uniref:Immunoglobulin like and fibronectin type III domain containing 1 n=1 Tax=Coturnix japonica TaxID=93934 RepID=A0A8C2T826_COTJA
NAVKPLKKSSIRGVHITQFVDKVPKGCSTPDFERKPVSLTLQEGKSAIFRAAVKGVPAPEVKWKRAKGEMNDPAKYLMFYSPATSEHILQINKINAGDSDLYRCIAVNEYGEASCAAGLRIIQGRTDNFCHPVVPNVGLYLKKNLQDLKKTLKKRAPLQKQKTVDKETIFQLLLHADRKDYEKICIKYGISDFRGMLRALQELKKDTESEQAKLIHSVRNMEHIKVNKDGTASFSLEMDLKSASSNIYLLKDGEKVRYGTGDEYRKYYVRQIGKKYYFIVNDVHPEDAGLYQVRVEDVPVFSTELDAESIPVRFQKPLRDLRCHEGEDVVFECVLRTPCFDAVWLHKAHPLDASEKHHISMSPDGLTHQLVVKNTETSDNGLYTLDTGLCSSRAWLLHLFSILFSEHSAPRSRVNKQLNDVVVLKGEPAELSCAVNRHDLTGTWFKDGLKLTSMEGVTFEKEGLVHKLIINKVEDIHAGKYRFEAGDIKTEATIFIEDPPQVDEILLRNLMSVPTVAKAGEKVVIRIPFEGRLPVRAMWLKDKIELGDDSRIRIDKTDTFTMLSISSAERKDCGDYKVRLKNDSGILDIDLKVEVIDKPQPPAGPLKIVGSSANDVTIQWNPPKDDGGKPVQNYIIEKQQVGRSDWVTLGEAPKNCTTFTTSKVEQDTSYYFRVRAVNAEGSSNALESNEAVTISKASPGAPDPPEIIGVTKDSITISWKAPRKAGSSRISGYIVQKRKKGSMTWVPVNSVPIKLKITDLKKGLQYEFCVAAVNASGMGDISAPSQAAFARDSTKPPGKVGDLKMTISDSTSITLTWNAPEAKEGSSVKGYDVEIRSSNNLSWSKCNIFPIETTSYKVKGLQAKEMYFLRVRAYNDCGPGEPTELEARIEAAPPVVSPRFIIDKTVKNFLVIKAGNPIRVNIPFEAPPGSVLTWSKDGVPLPSHAKISTQDDTTQLLIKEAEFTDTGIYTIELMSGTGRRETFSFQVQVTDIPQPPGPIELRENVPNIVTVIWEPSTSEKWERNLFYTVMKRESQKGVWHVVGDLIYTNKFTYTKVIPGRDYYFRVVAKNHLGSSPPSDTVQPWRIQKPKADIEVRPQRYRGVNQNQPPRFLVPLKPHVVITGSECRMSCAVGGHPPPKVTWYKDGRDLSNNPAYFGTNDFGVCSLVILGVSKSDEGDYMVEATNVLGRAFSRASLTIKGNSL